MYLIVGLGNPGRQYTGTRHNVGFMVLDALASRLGCGISRQRFHAVSAECRLDNEKLLLLEPQTFMNLSGQSVVAASGFYQIPIERMLVVHDDLDLELGRLKLQLGGGHAGHKGVRSIVEQLGESAFVRVRIGIGRPAPPMGVADYVLTPFLPSELNELEAVINRAADALESVVRVGLVETMNRYNQTRAMVKAAPDTPNIESR